VVRRRIEVEDQVLRFSCLEEVVVNVRNASRPPTPTSRPADLLDEWVGVGLIAPEQADRIREHEQARHDRRRRLALAPTPGVPAGPSLVVEALGYLGGVIMLVGAGILVGLYWADIPMALRLLLMAVTVLALVGAGVAVPDRLGDAAARLSSVLWALGVAASGVFFTVLSTDVLDRHDEDSLVVVGFGTAVVAAVLWWLRRSPLQQLALLVPLVIGAAGLGWQLGGDDSSLPSLAMWTVGAAWTALAWAGLLTPRATGVALGALAAVFGTMGTESDLLILLGLLTAVAMVALALSERSLPWLAVAALATLWTAPRAAVEWFPGRLSAALTLIVTGGLLVGAAVWVARHQGATKPPAG
jgi:hypothetical protein